MPGAAIATGCVDFVLPVEIIASALIALVMTPGAAAWLRSRCRRGQPSGPARQPEDIGFLTSWTG